jgi:hypothetical protein
MLLHTDTCLDTHDWAPWAWRSVQFPAEGRRFEVVWARACATCGWNETRRTRPHQPPCDGDSLVRGVLTNPLTAAAL